MTGRCLGDRVADLADGRMPPAEAERAFAHVASCSACRAALDAQRAASSALDAAPAPAPSSDFLARLSAIPAATPAADPLTAPAAIPAQPGAGQGGAAGVRPSGPAGPAAGRGGGLGAEEGERAQGQRGGPHAREPDDGRPRHGAELGVATALGAVPNAAVS